MIKALIANTSPEELPIAMLVLDDARDLIVQQVTP